ncbi:uncharacterized protein PAC_16765 [Phialocephala subalpina]|uniref:SET domain-containing protein n=1 Tax=Phialocephala subalpina TaxID=576137 RepID=A0A1L7XPB4_9HELO|nr:uncharacterized protein PAC_16765 [Phialocephala subalpina]
MMAMRSADQGRDIGAALDLFTSLMNHSCDPNAFVFCEGAQLRARSSRPIAAGEEITINYVDPSYDYSFRQKRLKPQYFFACQCERCRIDVMGQGPVSVHLRSRSPDFEDVQGQLLEFHSNLVQSSHEPCTLEDLRDKEDQMGLIGTAGFLNNGWPDYVQPGPEILQSFALIYLLQDELERSLRLCLKLCFIIGESTYGTSSPQWVHILSVLVQVLAAMVHRPKANPPSGTLSKTKIPLPEIHGACLCQFAEAVKGMYGADSAFARAADQLLEWEMNERRKLMSNDGFIAQFRKEYSALFQWADAQ